MLYTNYTEEILEIPDIIVTNRKKDDRNIYLYAEMKLKMQVCPNCKMETKRVHGYRQQQIKDVPMLNRNLIIKLKRRRYYCPYCGKTFYEKLSFLKRYQRITLRLMAKIMDDYKREYSTKSIAELNGVSSATAIRVLDMISYPLPRLPDVIGIDEFKGNAGKRKFQCILTNPKKRKVLDIMPSKNSEELYAYFLKFPISERNNVKYIVMDMSNQFHQIMKDCFPNAQIIIDKFHVCRHVTWALENVRKVEQKKFPDYRRKYFKKSRWIMLKRSKKLTSEDHMQLENMIKLSPRLGEAYWLKENFYEFMDSKNVDDAKKNLGEWNLWIGHLKLEEFTKCFEMIQRWQHHIFRAFSIGYTNGFTEGCNNKIKVLKRNCYGVRNFARFRNRILHMMSA